MIATRLWSPDTCQCQLSYQYDTDLADADKVFILGGFVRIGPEHSSLSGVTLYNAIMDENTRKNLVLTEAGKIDPSVTLQEYQWSFDASRVLIVELSGKLDAAQKTDLQTAVDTRFGAGKVQVL